MLSEDEKRLQREADIAKAIRGPDYSELEASIGRNKAAENEAKHTQVAANAKFDMYAAQQKAMYESVYTPPVSSNLKPIISWRR